MLFIKKYFTYLLLSLLIIVLSSYYVLNNVNNKYDFSNNTFQHVEIKGNAYVKGYVYTIQLNKEIGVLDGEKYDYVMFKIVDTKSDELKKFLNDYNDNSFVSADSIGLGCYKNGNIKYSNNSAEFGEKEYALSKKDSKLLMNSFKRKPVILNLYFGGRTLGKCAQTCYSYISNIEVMK